MSLASVNLYEFVYRQDFTIFHEKSFYLYFQTDIEKLRTRIQEINDSYNDLEVQVAQVQSESKDLVEKSNQDNDGKEKLLEAKIEDLGDRLRLGMGKLQQAIGETSASVNGKNNHFDVI